MQKETTEGKTAEEKAAEFGFKVGDRISSKNPGHHWDHGTIEQILFREGRPWARFNGGMCGGFLDDGELIKQ